MSHSEEMQIGLSGLAIVSLLAVLFRDDREKGSSRAPLLFAPVAFLLALSVGIYSHQIFALQAIGLALFIFVTVRWGIAIMTRENSRHSIVYLLLSSFALTLAIFGFATP